MILTGRCPEATRALLGRRFPDSQCKPDLLPGLQRQLRDYFAGRRVRFRVGLDLSAVTAFQRRVLQACAGIPYGETVTYGELARRVGRPTAARAVGGALARNPVPLVVPCHRVIAGDGSLGGFSAEQGVRLKRWLLTLESDTRSGRPGKSADTRSGRPPSRLKSGKERAGPSSAWSAGP